jgi:hypothetical protein
LFDLTSRDAPIPQFVNAMKMEGIEITEEEVLSGLRIELETPQNMTPFITYRTTDGVALMLAVQDSQTEEWKWKLANPGEYWNLLGKEVGVYVDGAEFKYPGNIDYLKKYFVNGIVSLNGQVRPNADRHPSNAEPIAKFALSNEMSLFFHYVVEPGKYPSSVNNENVDEWLDSRFQEIIDVVKDKYRNMPGKMAYIVFNEAWEGNQWNLESNPMRNKYGNEWIDEYVFQLLQKFIENEMIPGKNFVIIFNDANLYNRPNKQDLVFKTLYKARTSAFDRMVSNPETKKTLESIGINEAEDIQILLGVQTSFVFGQNIDSGIQIPEPTVEQINNLADKFSPLGGIIMTEVNPRGTIHEQYIFLEKVSELLKNNSNIKGVLLWNIFEPNDPNELGQVPSTELFNKNRELTRLHYSLLSD